MTVLIHDNQKKRKKERGRRRKKEEEGKNEECFSGASASARTIIKDNRRK
jgi:hypothetical protein